MVVAVPDGKSTTGAIFDKRKGANTGRGGDLSTQMEEKSNGYLSHGNRSRSQLEEQKKKERTSKAKRGPVHTLIRGQGGYTYVEVAVVLSLCVILIPAVMSLHHTLESDLKQLVGKQHLQGEAAAWMSRFRDEVRSGGQFRISKEGGLLFELPSGDTVQYKQNRRRLIRRVRHQGEKQFKGTTILAHDVYYAGFETDGKGVKVDIGLQNWHSDLTVQTYIRGRTP